MSLQLDDTIVALSSPAGPGGRAIVRLSGPKALAIAATVFSETLDPLKRGVTAGSMRLPGVTSPLDADLYLFPAPHSLTGQTVVEMHLISSPPLVDLLISQLMCAGARA